MRILLAEDDTSLAQWMVKVLAQNSIVVDWISSGDEVLNCVAKVGYDALILDLGLPQLNGEEVINKLRKNDIRLPILVLTAMDNLEKKVETLRLGADDFLAKPFAIEELEARLEALIRRAGGSQNPRLSCGELSYNLQNKQFTLANEVLNLSRREAALLKVLLQHPNEPLGKQEIYLRLFSDDYDINAEVVEVIVHRLRKKINNEKIQIAHIRGLGYLLQCTN